jgi:hypothetical protein
MRYNVPSFPTVVDNAAVVVSPLVIMVVKPKNLKSNFRRKKYSKLIYHLFQLWSVLVLESKLLYGDNEF